jgi:hypothetical protein
MLGACHGWAAMGGGDEQVPAMHGLSAEEPRRIGRYRLLGRLGQGGMGTVYLGEDDSGRKVAVKVINPSLAQQETFRQRFRREAEAAGRVRRFCTAPVIEAALDGERLYAVTEYVEGPTLEQAVRTGGSLPGSTLEALAVGVATALTAIHDAGVVHRDLKPSNVLLSSMGPRVIDFGIARALDTADGVTGSGEVVGTPHYIAPEILRGEAVTPACDVFAWGCLVTFAGTGRPPFTAATTPAVIYRILHEEPPLDDLDPALRGLVAEALSKDPAGRPSARRLLERLVGGQATGLTDGLNTELTVPLLSPPAGETSGSPSRAAAPPATASAAPSAAASADAPATSPATPLATPLAGRQGGRRIGGRLLLAAGVALAALAASATIILQLSPGSAAPGAAPVRGTPLFSDDFVERRGWDGWSFDPAGDTQRGYEISRGVYTMRASKDYPWNTSLSPVPEKAAAAPVRDVMVGVTAVMRDDAGGQGEFGLACRYDEDVPVGYLFVLRADGRARVIRIDGASRDLGKPVRAQAPARGEPVRVQAACGGNRLTMWINGEKVIEATDAEGFGGSPASQAGLVVGAPESGDGTIMVEFDDFDVHAGP